MTEQNKPVNPSAGIPQRQGQPMRPAQHRPAQGLPPQTHRPQNPGNPPLRRGPAPQGHPSQAVRQHPAGQHPPLRQGQIPPRQGMQRSMQQQRPVSGYPQAQQSPIGHTHSVPPQIQNQIPQQSSGVPNNNPQMESSYQSMELSPLQSFLSNSRNLAFILMGAIIFGILLGALMFGGSSQPVKAGLQNVVRNQDIRQKLPLCGRVVKGQACVLYIMNATRYDQLAENFFNDALKLTEVPEQRIKWANPKYAKHRIPPGAFAEIFIPSLR